MIPSEGVGGMSENKFRHLTLGWPDRWPERVEEW
jgi:hypothetical protein